MKFRNPWIDPRIEQVGTTTLQSYLVRRGWRPLTDSMEHFQSFERPASDNFGPIVNVPLLERGRDFVQRVIEVVTDLATAEDRYAVEVLDDILASAAPANSAPIKSPVHEPTLPSSVP